MTSCYYSIVSDTSSRPQAIVLQSKSRSPASAEDKFPPLETLDGTALSSFYDVHAFTDLKKVRPQLLHISNSPLTIIEVTGNR